MHNSPLQSCGIVSSGQTKEYMVLAELACVRPMRPLTVLPQLTCLTTEMPRQIFSPLTPSRLLRDNYSSDMDFSRILLK